MLNVLTFVQFKLIEGSNRLENRIKNKTVVTDISIVNTDEGQASRIEEAGSYKLKIDTESAAAIKKVYYIFTDNDQAALGDQDIDGNNDKIKKFTEDQITRKE
ncbi:hypothetical protein TVAG_455330 [Trichomonas vaginalis G3]|uniref:Uncharacterized protein n=1 Tax=Trichomonas vaginalis (strain ATCC PRA-98 / G3) TaxID=412133 RepID=A2GFC4_TRIV3|nr:hypothetical protein TVAGG3_0565970 [Trichomonas vaginalis G3]EAX84141.1 hypothetical protein TVAG_455330 [Trichomonas vaginalis G3]KAI5521582.1 hypothetical protein TVAGG3_0565970 [Trichomonas vaginalis G3]|eukprot:XP_001297071.1 hypothetical protein [Trichomonas vaginalis G3]